MYLGGNEQSTQKYVSELLGKETIDINTYGKSTGYSGNYSTNYQNTGRDLMTPDEVRMLENEKAILFIRGEKPIIDYKYDLLKHPNVKYTADGEGKIFEHGDTSIATASFSKLDEKEVRNLIDTNEKIKKINVSYELLSEEDIEEYFLMEEYEDERKNESEENKQNN